MKHLYFTFCLLFIMSFNAVKETSAFEKKTSQNTKSNKIQAIEDKKIVKKNF